MADRLAGERREQRVDMIRQRRPRIDDGDAAAPDDIRAGALEGEGARIARDDAADQRRQRLGDAVLE